MKDHLTSAQHWLIHTLEALAIAAIVTGFVTIVPVIESGHTTVSSILILLAVTVLAVFFKGLSGALSNQQSAQAFDDTLATVLKANQTSKITTAYVPPTSAVKTPEQVG